MVSLFVDRINKKAGEYTVIRKLIKHMLTQKVRLGDNADHDIILSKPEQLSAGSLCQSGEPGSFAE